jgi:hypothetical protein
MKTVLTVMCWLGVAIMLGACSDSDSGSSGGGGDYPQVSFEKTGSGDTERVVCYNATSNTITTSQICIWNCAYYESDTPQYVKLTFGQGTVCYDTGETDDEGNAIQECNLELALLDRETGACRL